MRRCIRERGCSRKWCYNSSPLRSIESSHSLLVNECSRRCQMLILVVSISDHYIIFIDKSCRHDYLEHIAVIRIFDDIFGKHY
jgi:hypothetical protein